MGALPLCLLRFREGIRTMKKVFVVFLMFAGLGGVAVWQWFDKGTNERQVRYERDRAQLHQRLVQSLPQVISQDENNSDEIQSWLSIYFREFAGLQARAEYKEFPAFFNQDAMIQGLEANEATIPKEKYASQKEAYDFTKAIYDKMRMGDYKAEVTSRKDSFRLDLFNIRQADVGGNNTLLADFAMWNFPGELSYGPFSSSVCLGPNTMADGQKALEAFEAWKKEALEIVNSHIEEQTDFGKSEAQARREAYKPAESIMMDAFGGELKLPLNEEKFFSNLCIKGGRRQIDADSSEPYVIYNRPSRFIPDFPRGVVIGTYMLPLIPAHSKYMTMELSYSMRTPNGTPVELPVKFERWELDESWMMEGGRDWQDAKVSD
jgi:hypothetical protein